MKPETLEAVALGPKTGATMRTETGAAAVRALETGTSAAQALEARPQ